MSAATAAASPVPCAASGGGGVFSRCLIGSGAAGAAGLYGRGVNWAESRFCSTERGLTEDVCWCDAAGVALGAPWGGGGGGESPMGAGLTTASA